jgi:hypothetical protein
MEEEQNGSISGSHLGLAPVAVGEERRKAKGATLALGH